MPVQVMGILNLTPDSFSDGGQFLDPARALIQARAMIEAGADILDLGGESTRPGADPVPVEVELSRVIPVISAIRAESRIPISIDSFKPQVARAAVQAGASVWNDVTALGSPGALDMAAELGCDVVLMHMKGEPQTMQVAPHYEDVVAEVAAFLLARADQAVAAGVDRSRIWLDPGIGFGKTLDHNLTLMTDMDQIVALGFPVLLGVSRKRFIQSLDPFATEPAHRLGGSLAAALSGAKAGVAAVRVHDVRETVQALKVWEALT